MMKPKASSLALGVASNVCADRNHRSADIMA